MAAGARGARWVCGEGWKPESGRAGEWEPGSLAAWGLLCRRPILRAFWLDRALHALHWRRELCRAQSPCQRVQCSPVQSRAVQCCTLVCRARSVSLSQGRGVCSDARAQCQWASRRTGERSPTGVLRCQGPGVRVKREGREGKGLPGTEPPAVGQTRRGKAPQLSCRWRLLLV